MSFTRILKRSGLRNNTSNSGKSGQRWTPKPYQLECIKFGLKKPEAGFFLAPGLGKTSITLFLFKILYKLNLVDAMLVLAKRRIVYGVWRQEVKKWGLPFDVTVVHGPNKLEALECDAEIFLMNYEGLHWLVEKRGRTRVLAEHTKRWLEKYPRVMLVVDESSKLRNTRTERFKRLKRILSRFVRRYILTGSPAPKGLLNLFGQVYTLDMGDALGTYITHYRNEYFIPTGYMGHTWVPQEDAEERIFKKLRPLVKRYGTDQLNLPPLTFIDRWVTLPPDARELYTDMKKEMVAYWRQHEITAANAAVASMKCRQIANGGLFLEDEELDIEDIYRRRRRKDREYRTIHDEKCAELLELLEELEGEPALVAFEFKHDLLRARRYFEINKSEFADAPFIAGGTSDRAALKIQKQWDHGYLPMLWGHPNSVAHGLNLQGKGGIVIYFSMTYDLENYEQFYQRVWRQGQRKRVLAYRLLARNTVDEAMIKCVGTRDTDQQRFLRALGDYYEL